MPCLWDSDGCTAIGLHVGRIRTWKEAYPVMQLNKKVCEKMAAQPSESQRHAPTCHGLSPVRFKCADIYLHEKILIFATPAKCAFLAPTKCAFLAPTGCAFFF